MFRNFLTLAFRNLRKRKVFSFINIFGLAMGVGACLVILRYIDFETSYDSFHDNIAGLYRVNRSVFQNSEQRIATITTSYGLGPALTSEIPEIKRFIRTHPMYGGAVMTHQPQQGDAVAFLENNILMADSTFFRAFSFKSLRGHLTTALDDPNSLVITRSTAKKYFGDADPLGKTLKLAGGWEDGDYAVAAVIEDVPQNSHFVFDVLLPLHNIFSRDQYKKDDGWSWNNFVTYVQLNDNATRESAQQKLPGLAKRNIDVRHKESGISTHLELQSLRDIHLNPGLRHDGDTVSRSTIYFFGLIAVFILVIAWINYINLSTARALERAREVGIKKAIGAFRRELIVQFLFESVVINLIGIALAVGLAVTLLPILGGIIGKRLSFDFTDLRLWFTLTCLFITGSFASGMYPAFVLSSFKITTGLKGNNESRGFSLRKTLVVFQFSASLILIAGTFVVYRQIHFMHSQDKGLQMDQMLIVTGPNTLNWHEARQKLSLFKEEVKKIPGVEAVATSGAIPGGGYNWGTDVRKSGVDAKDSKDGSIVWIDPDFITTYNIPFASGKNFDLQIRSSMKSVIINEAAVIAYGLGNPEQALNEKLIMSDDTLEVLGVLKNYNWNSLKSEYVPFLFRADTVANHAVSIHLEGQSIASAVEAVGKRYKELIPGEPYNYYFLDDFFNTQYKSDQQFGEIFALFAILAVTISCLGLGGLASFTTLQKLKEISVRKVLGASAGNIVYLLSGQFLKLVLIAAVIAMPMAWYGMNSWLSGFAFRVGLHWDLFVVPVAILMLIALLTVSLQVLKGASTNPAKVLRTE
jgi:putative ABC transport system permease protein